MTWINIDANQGITIGRVMLDSGYRSVDVISRLRALAGSGGLGSAAGEIDAVIGSSTATLDRAVGDYLAEGVDMISRLQTLVQEQAAGSVIGAVVSPAAAIAAGTVVGGYSQVSAKSWASGTLPTFDGGGTWTAPNGLSFDVVYNPRANELLGGGTAVLSSASTTAAIPSGNIPARLSPAEYNKLFNDQLWTLAMPPMWAAKVASDATWIGAGGLNSVMLS